MNEPDITINGRRLTTGEAMTVRNALNAFAYDLQDGLGEDDMGKDICRGYQAALRNLFSYMKENER
jgi:hypothetical protein